uniref:Uncharacterized protein n=1 Tax=Xiphophorus maculatus TaxID=8083 RepID=A0A3B5PPF4_XIPMA
MLQLQSKLICADTFCVCKCLTLIICLNVFIRVSFPLVFHLKRTTEMCCPENNTFQDVSYICKDIVANITNDMCNCHQ